MRQGELLDSFLIVFQSNRLLRIQIEHDSPNSVICRQFNTTSLLKSVIGLLMIIIPVFKTEPTLVTQTNAFGTIRKLIFIFTLNDSILKQIAFLVDFYSILSGYSSVCRSRLCKAKCYPDIVKSTFGFKWLCQPSKLN